jgi:hypothetical protein
MPREHIPLSSTKVRQQPNSSNNVRTYLPIDKLVCIGVWVLGPGLLKPPGCSTGPSPSESGCVWPGLRQWWVGCQRHAAAVRASSRRRAAAAAAAGPGRLCSRSPGGPARPGIRAWARGPKFEFEHSSGPLPRTHLHSRFQVCIERTSESLEASDSELSDLKGP